MRKFLSIVIPRYKETEKDLFPLFSSIYTQAGVDMDDIEVIVVTDGGGNSPVENNFLSLFDMDIRQYSLDDNVGPGLVRQMGIDMSRADYIMFCDADDCLYSSCSLNAIITELERSAPDILTTEWMEEIVNGDHCCYNKHGNDFTWMHGKVVRRAYVNQKNIRFHPELRVHEDSYFLLLAATFTDRRVHLPWLTYLWKWNDDSITRRNNSIYEYESMPEYIRAESYALKTIESTDNKNMGPQMCLFVIYMYFTLHLRNWLNATNRQYLHLAEESFRERILPFWTYWEQTEPAVKMELYNYERQRVFSNEIETETLQNWLRRLGLESGGVDV